MEDILFIEFGDSEAYKYIRHGGASTLGDGEAESGFGSMVGAP